MSQDQLWESLAREKLEDVPAEPVYILTRRGVGYYFSNQN